MENKVHFRISAVRMTEGYIAGLIIAQGPRRLGIPDTVSPTSKARLGRGWEELLEHTTQQDKLPCGWDAIQLRRTAKSSIGRGPKASSFKPVVFQATPHLFSVLESFRV